MAIYRLEKDNYNGTTVEVQSDDKTLFNRLEVAIDHVFAEREKELAKRSKRKMMVEKITIEINLPKLTDYEDCKPMLKHICSVVTRETGVKPRIECMGIKK